MQLLVEQALAAYITQEGILSANYRIYPAHGAEIIVGDRQDYLRIVASRPRGGFYYAGNPEFPVEFQLFTGGIEDEAKLAAISIVHDAIAESLADLWLLSNIQAALAALNLPIVPGIGFSGWEIDTPEDGRSETQLIARLKYNFTVFMPTQKSYPDLYIQTLTRAGVLQTGVTQTFTAIVRNKGKAASAATLLRFSLDGATLIDKTLPALAPGASATITHTWVATVNAHTLRATADPKQALKETSKANNTRSLTFTIADPPPPPVLPDLVVAALTITGELTSGVGLTFSATVTNIGDTLAAASTLRFSVDGVTLGDVAVGALAAAASQTVTSPAWTATAGSHTILAEADKLGVVSESEEGNNTLSSTFSVEQSKSPVKIFQLGNARTAFANAAVNGLTTKMNWVDLQPTSADAFAWESIDDLIGGAQAAGKEITISLVLLTNLPQWLLSTPGVVVYTIDKNGVETKCVMPWDPVVRPYLIAFIQAFCAYFDGRLDGIIMGGLGLSPESYMPDPDEIGLDLTTAQAIAAWETSSNGLIDTYSGVLTKTPFIMAMGIPYTGGTTALQAVVDRAAGLYSRFGVMQWGLNALSNNGYVPNALVETYSPTHPAGFQMKGNEAGTMGSSLNGTLQEAIDAGIALGAQWLEIYGDDCAKTTNAPMLTAAAAAVSPPP